MERCLIGCELWSLTISWETQPLFTELQHFFPDTQKVCMTGRKGKGKPQGKWHWNAGVFATSGKHNNADSYSPYFFSSQKETKNQNKIQRKRKKEQNHRIISVKEFSFEVFSTSCCISGAGVVLGLLKLYC